MPDYEFLIAGGGGAGLSLAYHLAASPLASERILIVDPQRKDQNDRTWCYWTREDLPFNHIAHRSWEKLRITDGHFDQVLSLGDYRYYMVRGIDFYRLVQEKLETLPNVSFKQGRVTAVEDGEDQARVTVDGEVLSARWVFDSRYIPGQFSPDSSRYHHLLQHFKGWEIETELDCFDPGYATLFDFRTQQKESMRFFYILPFSPRHALVEYTIFSAEVLSEAEYQAGLRDYVENVLGLRDYRVSGEENGVIPMTDQPLPRSAGRRVLNIGTRGGRVKPSSGYAFLRMQQDAAGIVESLLKAGSPFRIEKSPGRYRFYDSLMLQVMYREGGRMSEIFTQLFAKNPIRRIFRFLDEQASPLEDARLLASLPKDPFLRALVKTKLLGKI